MCGYAPVEQVGVGTDVGVNESSRLHLMQRAANQLDSRSYAREFKKVFA
jgi:hypothetical protein